MERFARLSMILIATTGLSACALGPREGPPAPIVQITPRDSGAERREAERYEQVREAPPAREVKPAPKPKPKTRVFAYKDPNAEGPEDLTPRSEQTQVAMVDPKQAGTAAPDRQVAPKAPEQPADKPDLRSKGPVSEGPSQESASSAAASAPPVDAPNLSAAAQALASQAEKQRQSGDYTGAAASLERSLRIAPREAYLWNRLARVRMEQGQVAQAGSLASRSNDLAGKSGTVKKDNWRIIAEAKRRSGDVAGAAEAEKQAGGD